MKLFTAGLIGVLFLISAQVGAETLYVPDFLWKREIAVKTAPKDIADTYLGIPYREDGTLDDQGAFTTFNEPDIVFDAPGLNCSGLVLSVARFLFNRNFTLTEAIRDRQGNSGPDSDLGRDWDFGFDLTLNITAGAPRRVITPDGKRHALADHNGLTLRGFDLHDRAAWKSVLNQMLPGRAYFGSISKATRRPGYEILHYHVVLILPDEKGHVWLYHATQKSRVHRMDLATERGLRRLMAQFSSRRGGPKKILLVEAKLPELDAPKPTVADAGSRKSDAVTHGEDVSHESDVPAVLAQLDNPGGADSRANDGGSAARTEANRSSPAVTQPSDPGLVANHLSGTVFTVIPEMVTHLPKLGDEQGTALDFWYRNRGPHSRRLEILVRGPDGDRRYEGSIEGGGTDLTVRYPRDFGGVDIDRARKGRYGVQVSVDGEPWLADVVEIAEPRDARPVITQVRAPNTVRSGQTFTVKVTARNEGAESDYGGITVSSPDPSGLRLVSAKPGKIYGRGSTVLSVTSDRIRTEVPMAERWIDLWPEDESYTMDVRVKAAKPGTYPLYVRCALRSVKVKSSVVLMDPKTSDTADQQGFPVKVLMITVQ